MPGSHSTDTVHRAETATSFEAVIVGAGFAGLYMLHRVRGLGFSARIYEVASGVGVPGSGIGIRARAAMSRAWSTPTLFRGT
jgi:flavin-dependent dehydrogenase